MTSKPPSLVEVDSLDIHVLINDEIDQISPSPNPRVRHAQSFAGVPLSPVSDPSARGGARLEMPMRNICCGAHGLSLFIVRWAFLMLATWTNPLTDSEEGRQASHVTL
jgi:7,8-dihydropterin-6-yl-methyl-4-(beta-D-ribofuranosyl)aminobenzene 5'-phosphate synthase